MHPLIHDWNLTDAPPVVAPILLDDETLRDGLQSPSVTIPSVDRKIEILHLIDALGIDTADIGLPGAGPHVARDVERLAREIQGSRLRVRPNCAARTKLTDIRADRRDFAARDRDLAVANSLAAVEAGATRLHGTALGIGERVGNTPMDMLLVNLALSGPNGRDLTPLPEYCRVVADAYGVEIPANYPVVGADAYRTATGVHAAAVIKAFRKDDAELADAVYSGVPARLVGRAQTIDVGPMSGRSNVVFWLEQHRVPVTDDVVDRVFAGAKASSRVLSDVEIEALIASGRPPNRAG